MFKIKVDQLKDWKVSEFPYKNKLMTLTNIQSYSSLCENPELDPAGIEDTILEQVKQTMSTWDTSTPNSQDAIQLHKEALLNFSIANGMSRGLVFVQTIDKIGGTLHIFHNICLYISWGAHRGNKFVYLNDVQSNDIKWFPFKKSYWPYPTSQ